MTFSIAYSVLIWIGGKKHEYYCWVLEAGSKGSYVHIKLQNILILNIMNLWILISFGYMYKKDKLTRMFSTECCRELTIESGSSGAESRQFAGFHGHYEFKFKKANLVQIKKGFFVYKKTRKAKYIFKSQDGIWMVRYFNYLLICR